MFARLENLGPFHFFFTLSCADLRWAENFTTLLDGHDIVFERQNGQENILVDNIPLDTFLKSHCSDSKHTMIKENLFNATMNFHHRLKTFLKEVVLNGQNPLAVDHYCYRIEFQLRGAAHAHGTIWIDWDKLKDFTENEKKVIQESFEKIKKHEVLQKQHLQHLAMLADKFVSCSIKDPKTKQIVKDVNIHHHTKQACYK